MKKLIVILLAALSVSAYSQSAKVYFIRDTGSFAALADFKEFVDGKLVFMIDNKSYNSMELPAGEHTITWQTGQKELKEEGKQMQMAMNLEAGKSYYFQMLIVKGFMKIQVQMNEVTESTAKKLMSDLKEDVNPFK